MRGTQAWQGKSGKRNKKTWIFLVKFGIIGFEPSVFSQSWENNWWRHVVKWDWSCLWIFMTSALIHTLSPNNLILRNLIKYIFGFVSCMTKKRHKDAPIAGNAEILLYLSYLRLYEAVEVLWCKILLVVFRQMSETKTYLQEIESRQLSWSIVTEERFCT